MNPPRHVLYVTRYRESDLQGLEHAIRISETHEAKLTIASMMPEMPEVLSAEENERLFQDLTSVEGHRMSFVYGDLLDPARKRGMDIGETVLTGIPFISIIHHVQEHGIDLVVISNRKRSGEDAMGLGSTALHLLRKCPCMVWVVQSGQEIIRNVTVAVDPVSNPELHLEVIETADNLAKFFDAQLHVIHAWRLKGEELLNSSLSQYSAERIGELKRAERERHRQALDDLAAKVGESDVVMREGLPGPVVVEETKERKSDLLVMGTITRTGIDGYFIGHNSEYILNRTRCSVLAVKPRHFVSPVHAIQSYGEGGTGV